jgi:hypothetical protein
MKMRTSGISPFMDGRIPVRNGGDFPSSGCARNTCAPNVADNNFVHQ